MKLPSIQFYPADWRKDPAVQSLSYHDRGVWFEMLCLMHESEQRGKLLLNGKKIPDDALARLLGLDKQTLTNTLDRLLTLGVACECDLTGAICNRRMIRDEELRKIRQECGKMGGNPALLNHPANQKPTTRLNQKPTPSSSSSSSSSDGGEEPRAEVPSVEEAISMTMTVGILEPFVRYVYDDWATRQGKDASGNIVPWLPYVTKRWTREQVEWKAGTHRACKAKGGTDRIGPTLKEVQAYSKEKYSDPKWNHWAISFHSHWADSKRQWKRNGQPIDWKVEFAQQVNKWRTG